MPEKKKRYISYKVDSYLKDRFLYKPVRPRPWLAGLNTEPIVRALNLTRFCCVCSVSLLQVLTPWALCVSEVLSVLLIYGLCCMPAAVAGHSGRPAQEGSPPAKYHFSYWHSLEDVVGLSCTRAALLSAAYAAGMQYMHRPYLYASYLLAALCFPYLVVKMILFRYGSDAVPAAAIFIITSLFCWLHVFAARRSVEWARRRYQLGLGGGYPWEDDGATVGDGGWGLLRRSDMEEGGEVGTGRAGEDVPAETLADDDSKFLQVAGIKVHYKEVVPSTLAASSDPCAQQTGIVLVHGFGAGVFAWRHILEPLAIQCQCRVVAFDRPAFGLTSRPGLQTHQANPYTLGSQAHLLLSLCQALGLSRVVLAAHADGCLLALRAASMAMRPQPATLCWDHSGPGGSPSSSSSGTSPRTSKHGGAFAGEPQLPVSHGAYHPPGSITGIPPPTEMVACTGTAMDTCTSSVNQHATSATGTPAAGAGVSAFSTVPHDVVSGIAGAQDSGTNGGDSARTFRLRPRGSGDVVAGSNGHTVHQFSAADGVGSAGSLGLPPAVPRSGALPPPLPVLSELGRLLSIDSASSLQATVMTPSAAGVDGVEFRTVTLAALTEPGASGFDQSNGAGASSNGGSTSSLLRGDTGPVAGKPLVVVDMMKPQRVEGARHRRVQSTPGPVADGRASNGHAGSGFPGGLHVAAGTAGELVVNNTPGTPSTSGQGPWPQVLGLALLHPNLSGTQGPALSRLLASSRLGRSILRPLLRSELGEVANRRAWHNTQKLTAEVLELYKAPLRVEGWCESLIETTRLRRDQAQGDLPAYLYDARPLPALLLTGEHDRVVPPGKAELLSADLPHSHVAIVHGCGHLSHEEAPAALLAQLAPFCGQLLSIPAP